MTKFLTYSFPADPGDGLGGGGAPDDAKPAVLGKLTVVKNGEQQRLGASPFASLAKDDPHQYRNAGTAEGARWLGTATSCGAWRRAVTDFPASISWCAANR